MKTFFVCYLFIGFLFAIYIKWAIDTVGIEYLIEQLDEKPEDFDLNNPVIQFLIVLICVLFWPIPLILSITDKNNK